MNDDIDFNTDLDITLVTQLSIDRVWLLEGLCSRWGGRVAAAIFVRSQEDLDVVSMLQELLVGMFPVRIVAVSHIEKSDDLPEKADETADSLSNYPINSMRNVAIEYSDTSHYLLLDVDMWPSLELRDKLLEALTVTCPECSSRRSAVVVPAFAIRHKLDRYDKLRRLTLEQAKNHTHTHAGFVRVSCGVLETYGICLSYIEISRFSVWNFWWRDQSLRSQFHRCVQVVETDEPSKVELHRERSIRTVRCSTQK